MLHSDGVVFFWHKRNGGGGWSEAAFCLGLGLGMNWLKPLQKVKLVELTIERWVQKV